MSNIPLTKIRLFLWLLVCMIAAMTVLFVGVLSLISKQATLSQHYDAAVIERQQMERIATLSIATAVERDLMQRAELMQELKGLLETYRLEHKAPSFDFSPTPSEADSLTGLAMEVSGSMRTEAVLEHSSELLNHILQDLIPSLDTIIADERVQRAELMTLIFWSTALLMSLTVVAMTIMIRYIFRPVARAALKNSEMLTQAQDDLEALEFCDDLTNLPSRRGLQRFLEGKTTLPADAAPQAALVVKLEPVARNQRVLSDRFTQEIAREFADRLQKLRSDITFLAHCGHGHFFLLSDYSGPVEQEPRLVGRMEQLLFEPVVIHGSRVAVDLMAGYRAILPGEDMSNIYEEADTALGIALSTRAENRVRYTDDIRSKMTASTELGAELTMALGQDQLKAHYQPQINLLTGKVTGFEALVRWQHPVRGTLPPGLFLPLIDEMGLDDALGEVMLNQGLQALKDWEAAGFDIQHLGVNFSQAQLRDPRLVETLRWELDRFDMAADRLSVEVLENIYVENDEDRIAINIRALSSLGLKIDLDDFGTGTASITGLRRFCANRIKIDRSYISGLDSNHDNQKLVATMINMARTMGIEALAEGVETEDEMAFLRSLGCQTVQGYLIAKPMPFAETLTWLKAHNSMQGGKLGAAG
ncbi:putative bifunctional diguanylate cyclase/phosphodiesterase [Halovulum sp. GXIMD14793]